MGDNARVCLEVGVRCCRVDNVQPFWGMNSHAVSKRVNVLGVKGCAATGFGFGGLRVWGYRLASAI